MYSQKKKDILKSARNITSFTTRINYFKKTQIYSTKSIVYKMSLCDHDFIAKLLRINI